MKNTNNMFENNISGGMEYLWQDLEDNPFPDPDQESMGQSGNRIQDLNKLVPNQSVVLFVLYFPCHTA